nr:EthD domain-containing protein [Streptomyces sp. SID5643]
MTRPAVLIAPPASDAGETPVKVLHFVHKPEGPGRDDVSERWQAAHAAVLKAESREKVLRGYIRHRQVPGAERALRHFGAGGEPAYTGVAAVYYDSPEEALTHFPSYERSLRELSAETGDFYDPSRSLALYSREVTIF